MSAHCVRARDEVGDLREGAGSSDLQFLGQTNPKRLEPAPDATYDAHSSERNYEFGGTRNNALVCSNLRRQSGLQNTPSDPKKQKSALDARLAGINDVITTLYSTRKDL